jgi:hypothetical protein
LKGQGGKIAGNWILGNKTTNSLMCQQMSLFLAA